MFELTLDSNKALDVVETLFESFFFEGSKYILLIL